MKYIKIQTYNQIHLYYQDMVGWSGRVVESSNFLANSLEFGPDVGEICVERACLHGFFSSSAEHNQLAKS